MPEEIPTPAENLQPTEAKSPDWPKIVLAAVLGFGLLAVAAYTGYWYGTQQIQELTPTSAPTTTTPTPTPQALDCCMLEALEMKDLAQISEDACQECGGKWGLLSRDIDATGCNPKTGDAGKTCTNYDQCVGLCLAEDETSTSGVCSEYTSICWDVNSSFPRASR